MRPSTLSNLARETKALTAVDPLKQVEYANKAVENSGTAIGLRVKDGIVLAVEKLVQSKLLVPGSNKRIASVDIHAGVATAGLLADGRHVANRAREECESYQENYHSKVPTKVSFITFRLYVLFEADVPDCLIEPREL